MLRLGLVAGCLLALVWPAQIVRATELSESDKFFLAGYEQLRAALAADDLAKANKVAEALTNSGIEVPKSETLDRARIAFARVTKIAVTLTAGRRGYYVVRCPMLNKEWVQTSKQISNPYGGKAMADCGIIESD